MEYKIIHEFEAEINGIKFNNQKIFNTTKYIAEEIEEKFGQIDTELIKDLKEATEILYDKYDIFSFDSFENESIENIEQAATLKDLKITYDNSDWKLEKINKNLKDGSYEKEKNIPKTRSRSRANNKGNER